MTTMTFRSGKDTYVSEARPRANFVGAPYLQLRSGLAHALQLFPGLQEAVRRENVSESVLEIPVRGAWPTGTQITVAPVGSEWRAGQVDWTDRPGLKSGAPTASITTTRPMSNGELLLIPVTALVTRVANGGADLGWRISTGASGLREIHGFDTPREDGGPVLRVTISDRLPAPEALTPAGGAIGVAKWVCEVDWSDSGDDDQTTIGAIQVQISATESETSPDYDTGFRDVTEPVLPLADTTYPGLALDATTSWRARVRDEGGRESPWSPYCDPITRRSVATATWNSPANDQITDPSPVLEVLLSEPVKHVRWLVTRGTDRSKVRWDSGKLPAAAGTSASVGVPAKIKPQKSRGEPVVVFDDNDLTYQVGFRWWTRTDSVASSGDKAYREIWKTVTLAPAANPAPTSCTAAQVGTSPRIRIRWTRPAAADAWVIIRDGNVRVDVVEHDEVTTHTDGSWSWVDDTASPWMPHTYEVKAVERTTARGPVGQSANSPTSNSVTCAIEGTWFLRRNGEGFVIGDADLSGLEQVHRRATYSPQALTYDVYTRTAPSFLAGPISGTIDDDDDTGQDMWAAIELAQSMADPAPGVAGEVVRLVSGTLSMPVRFSSGPVVLPTAGFYDGDMRHDFRCAVQQASEYGDL